MQMSSKKNVIAIAVTTVALTVGSLGIAQATTKTKVVSTKVTRTSATGVANPIAKTGGAEEAVASVLSALVTKGTITQAQADAIKAAFAAAAPVRGFDGPGKGRDKGRGLLGEDRAEAETLISKTIGVDTATIRSRIAAGESLGAIAGAKRADLISVLVAEATKRIDAAVTAGKMTATQATSLKAGLTAHVTAEVDQVGGKRGPGMGGKDDKRGRGHGGSGKSGMGAAPKIPAPSATPSA
jgi:polyhydroxyalkanoate synthesis regulator phasin